jgi:hypothetical protein
LPATFKQRLERVLGSLHAEVVEQLRGLECFVLRIEPDTEVLEDMLVGADQHEFGTLSIEKLRRIDRDESATMESLTHMLRQIGPIVLLQADTGGASTTGFFRVTM